jgi:hypothetical protein
LTPTATDATATIEVNGAAVASGGNSAPIPLSVGVNTITIKVTAQDGTTMKTYTVRVNRAASSVATLSSLTLKGAILNPKFDRLKMLYTATVANSTSSLRVKPAALSSVATIKVNGIRVQSGSLSRSIALKEGKNTIKVVVSAQDGTSKTYKIVVTRGSTAKSSPLWAAFDHPIQSSAGSETERVSKHAIGHSKYLLLTVMRTGRGGNQVVEVSPNLVDWYSGVRHTTTLIDDESIFQVRDNTPIGPNQQRYIRLRRSR